MLSTIATVEKKCEGLEKLIRELTQALSTMNQQNEDQNNAILLLQKQQTAVDTNQHTLKRDFDTLQSSCTAENENLQKQQHRLDNNQRTLKRDFDTLQAEHKQGCNERKRFANAFKEAAKVVSSIVPWP
jgi:predicted  nucleic acid-binding Zn-ribbon protein